MASLYRKPILITDPATGQKIKGKSKKWWGQYKDVHQRLKRVPLSIDKQSAQAMLNQIVKRVEREKAGLVDPTEEQRKRPLADHVKEFKDYLTNKGVTPKQVAESTRQLQKMVHATKWKLIGDISAGGALDFLGGLRREGLSAQTYNHYLKAAKQFTRWLVRDRRTPTDPLMHLSRMNVRQDRRHDRRALSADEFARLVDAARGGKRVEGISGSRPGYVVRIGRLDRISQGGTREPYVPLAPARRRPGHGHRGGLLQQAPAGGHPGLAPRSGAATQGMAGY